MRSMFPSSVFVEVAGLISVDPAAKVLSEVSESKRQNLVFAFRFVR